MHNLKLGLVQRELQWEDPPANRALFTDELTRLETGTDLVVLPEMFITGFSMAAERIAEDAAEDTLPWMMEQARKHDCAICGSLPVRDNGANFNRLLFVKPDGTFSQYDKRHLFRMSGEDQHYSAGMERLVVQWRDWRICPQICYDLRFPVWTRNRGEYDLLLFVANWPAKRRSHWRSLLTARAIENQAYCVGANRIGSDGNGVAYSGDSLAISPDGALLLDCEGSSGVFTSTLDHARMDSYRSEFPCHMDADNFELR